MRCLKMNNMPILLVKDTTMEGRVTSPDAESFD